MNWKSIRVVVFFAAVFLTTMAQSEEQTRPEVGIVEKLGETIPSDIMLYDEHGNVAQFGNLLGKPAIITFVYYECSGICTPQLTELSRMVDKMDLEPGKDYRILTISFDHREKPELAASKKENYLSAVVRPVPPDAWRFLTGDSANVRRLTEAAGFYFKPGEKDWIHPSGLIVVSPTGKITRYINGIQYLPFDIKMAVIEASNGKVGPTIANVLRFCFSYDPESKSYVFNVVRIGGLVIVLLAAAFVFFLLRVGKKKTERQVRYGQSS
jgi:protein SCO1/2